MSEQEEFDNKYISTTEICQKLGIHRTTVLLAVRTGRLPTPIVIRRPNGEPQIMLWDRRVVEQPLGKWIDSRAQRAYA